VTLLGQGVGLGDPQRSLPTPTILWFCETKGLKSGWGVFFPYGIKSPTKRERKKHAGKALKLPLQEM